MPVGGATRACPLTRTHECSAGPLPGRLAPQRAARRYPVTTLNQTQDTSTLLEFMFRLGQAYLACGEQTAQVELRLRRVALACGMSRTRVIAFPTAILIAVHDETSERVTLSEGPAEGLRLDQMAEVYRLGAAAERAEITPREGLDRLIDILRTRPRFGRVSSLVGHTMLSVGLAMLLMPTPSNILAAAVLGMLVGLLRLFHQERTLFAVPTPVVAAALVSGAVFWAASRGLPVDPLQMMVPPLVMFLPGAMLTMGMVELAYGDMVSGSSRLMTGFVQLVLLAVGLAAGAILMGGGTEALILAGDQMVKKPWLSWVGVLLFCLGVFLHLSAPRNALPWIIVVALVAVLVQRVTAGIFGAEISGFFAMIGAMPVSYLIQMRFNGPPAMVTSLPAFWLVVPGSLGLLSVTRMMSDRAAGLEGLVTVVFVITAVALGTLVGTSLYRGVSEKLGWARAQLQRAAQWLAGSGRAK